MDSIKETFDQMKGGYYLQNHDPEPFNEEQALRIKAVELAISNNPPDNKLVELAERIYQFISEEKNDTP